MAISNDRLRDIATHHTPGTEEREMAAELLAARETIACIPARIVDAERNMSAIASAEWRRIGEDNIAELRTEWFGIAGGENSFPSDRSGDAMAQQRVRQWLADEVALRAQIGDERDRLRGNLSRALGVLRALRNDCGQSVFGADCDAVDSLLSKEDGNAEARPLTEVNSLRAELAEAKAAIKETMRQCQEMTAAARQEPPSDAEIETLLASLEPCSECHNEGAAYVADMLRRARPDDGELVRVVSDLRETLRKLRNAAWNKNRSPNCDKEIEQQFRGYGLNDAVGECDKLLAALAARKGAK